jgi:NADPH:quinone reductase-like Zn-dependent oxidoreductase
MTPQPTTEPTPPVRPEPPATMRAVVQDRYGGPDVLRVERIPVPSPGAGEVLLVVHAAGVDRGTWHLLTGLPYLMRVMGFGVRAPKNRVPGLDVAGTVIAIGDDVTRCAPGDEVFGISRGSFAEYALAREDKLGRTPQGIPPEAAAVLGVSGSTALQAIDAGRVTAGQHVLVLGASGGVGSYAVQMAVAAGAEVTGVCSAEKLDLVRSLGATHVVDYRRTDVTTLGRHYDVVIDTGGRTPLRRLRRILAPRGTLVIVGGENEGRWTGGFGRQLRAAAWSPFLRQRLVMLTSKEHHQFLDRLAESVAAGALTPALERTYPLEEAADALRRLAEGRVRGKIAVIPRPPR